MTCPAKPAFSFMSQQPVLQWALALVALIIWTCTLIMTCYTPMKVTAKTLKFTALLPLAMQLTYMAKARQSDFELPAKSEVTSIKPSTPASLWEYLRFLCYKC